MEERLLPIFGLYVQYLTTTPHIEDNHKLSPSQESC